MLRMGLSQARLVRVRVREGLGGLKGTELAIEGVSVSMSPTSRCRALYDLLLLRTERLGESGG